MSPRSGFSSDNQQLSFSSGFNNSRQHHHSRSNSGLVSDTKTPQHNARQLEDELINLNKKVVELEQQLEEVRRSHGADIEAASEEVRRQLEAEHLQKFSAVSKQIQTLQQSELDNLRTKLEEKHSVAISNLEARHSQEIINLKLSLQDVQDSSDKSELVESSKHGNNMTNDNKKISPEISEISPELYEAMKADIEKLEEEKYN